MTDDDRCAPREILPKRAVLTHKISRFRTRIKSKVPLVTKMQADICQGSTPQIADPPNLGRFLRSTDNLDE